MLRINDIIDKVQSYLTPEDVRARMQAIVQLPK